MLMIFSHFITHVKPDVINLQLFINFFFFNYKISPGLGTYSNYFTLKILNNENPRGLNSSNSFFVNNIDSCIGTYWEMDKTFTFFFF